MSLRAGSRLGHYEILSALGEGGMGEVYRARDTKLNRDVAIKILPALLTNNEERCDRFTREAQIIASLNHPGIVTIYSVEAANGTHFLTMELVDGKTLADLISKGGCSLSKILDIAIPLADAVSAAHQRGITHRDLKPANVMVTHEGRVKVLDFGLAKLKEAAPTGFDATMLPTQALTGEGRIVGTVAYMSPEQAEGGPADQRSDVFSLGVVLYELATGQRPFKGDTSLSVLSAVLRDAPRALTDINPELPRDLWRIVRHCLIKDPEHRYQSAKDLRNDLEELAESLKSGELLSVASTVHASRRRWPRRAALIVATAIFATAAALWFRLASQRTPPVLQATHTQLTQTAGVERFPNISPDGKWVVYVSAAAGNADIYLQSTTGQTAINLTRDSTAADTMPAFSPDGESIAFRSERDGGGLFVMGRTGESVRRLTTKGFYPSWFPDGRQIVFSTENVLGPEGRLTFSEVWAVSATGGEAHAIVAGDAVQPSVSPHGRRIAYWGVPADAKTKRFTGYNRDIWTVDVEGVHPMRVTDHEANDWNPIWSPDGQWLYFLSNRGGSMNLWRIAIDEATGVTRGAPQPLTAPAPYVAHFSLSADGRVGVYSSIIFTTNIGRVSFDARSRKINGAVQAVTMGPRDFYGFDVTPDGRFVVAGTGSRRGWEDLHVVSVDSGSIRQLTADIARDRFPVWAPGDRAILFQSDRGGDVELWSIDSDGSRLRQLTKSSGRGFFPRFSRDGTRVAVSDLNDNKLVVYDVRDFSTSLEVLPPLPDPTVVGLSVDDWSPDGRSLAIGGYRPAGGLGAVDLWVYSLNSRSYRRITDGNESEWLADGRHIIYVNRGRISLVDVASGASHEVLAIAGESLDMPHLTADNSQLFFTHSTTDGDIWVVQFGDSPKGSK